MTVHLVGAGPGSPDLLTLRASRLLDTADVVVHDRLVDPRVLDLVAPWAEVIDVGKQPGGPVDAQWQINQVLIEAAGRNEIVVRLKGGDPFVFGRGGEEAEVLRAAGIDVEVVPGITSAIAGPAVAGIPVTMRGHVNGFTVITGHSDPTIGRPIDWEAAARLGTTLVVLMGASRTTPIAESLLAGGMATDTPVAAVESASTPSQRIHRTTLAGMEDLRVRAPVVLIIGTVAGLDVTDSATTDRRLGDLISQLTTEHAGER
ncbi:MAG: uroporphyrinogen-III C-methyltransferase [Acidimicrobiales bacterium]|jgi:uroporphyrin-III C-methyltransferase|nr:uroporphyrinogen-III C-methyltransferase [Acidimicrobiaceae bacterium]MDP6076754.1 uroporphyrinogen-III C-methyltransferase [Acidimicrobiales bacterium]MDP7257924.1 uroporphyrinogen-III C-methyltransferase [Acidimicrobiales bacterium]HCV35744.1 uroporphyrinogen-III C-methyltransferase [Acidimicrobiaceae bacterium]HJO80346.1 uroporphyrinogen-III C-methyltransferase [Acidimicrobiales bacterium]|tara:strand:- start:4427 stop:5206 length:780 start_codon:yes stop_codon:yes gene_type:complete